jgi:OmpA-OmpF porin, OOP family
MNRVPVTWALILATFALTGCAKKSYVRQQVTPIINKVNELDQVTAENTREIKAVDARAQQGIQTGDANTDQLAQKVADADTRAQQATQAANVSENKANTLANTVYGLDNYHVVTQTSVHFAFNHSGLTPQAEQQLDQLGRQLSVAKGCIVVVVGGTDNAGNREYNYELSQHRADEVIRYLSEKYGLPPYKTHSIGLGGDKPIALNDTRDGRQKNRRAEVQLMSNRGGQSSQQSSTDDDEPQVSQIAPSRH